MLQRVFQLALGVAVATALSLGAGAATPTPAAAQDCTVKCGCYSDGCGCQSSGGNGSECSASGDGCFVKACDGGGIKPPIQDVAYLMRPDGSSVALRYASDPLPTDADGAGYRIEVLGDVSGEWMAEGTGVSVARHPCTRVIVDRVVTGDERRTVREAAAKITL